MEKLSLKAFTFASAVLWAVTVFLVAVFNCYRPSYGGAFLEAVSSVYPGYHATPDVVSILVGTGYALVDGAVAGAIFAWLYNGCVTCGWCRKKSEGKK